MDFASQALLNAFDGFTEREARVLIDQGRIETRDDGAQLTIEGQQEDTFYVLLKGQVEVTKRFKDNLHRVLNTLGPGDFFGEMSIIHDAPRAATITATGPVTVLAIDREAFLKALKGSPSMSLAMIREVSKRLRANDEIAINDLRVKADELSDAYEQLAELERARREFLTTIAHELRTPLMSAAGYMQLISAGMMEGEPLQNAHDTVTRNLSQIVSLTNDILFLQEMDLILDEFKPVHLPKLIDAILAEERQLADQMGVAFKLDIAPDLPSVPGDEQSLQRALKAVINNAIKFSLNGGDVQITGMQNDTQVIISIKDQGIGIAEEDREDIYGRFWRTETHNGHLFSGVGLGLSIARQVIEQHGGQIKLESEVGAWTQFTITLPLQPRPE
jgi:signal transduction histidine kinase